MKSKKTIILLIILIILLCVIYFARQRSPVQKRVRLFSFPASQVAMVSLSDAADSLFIAKDATSGEWFAQHPLHVKVSPVKVNSFFSTVIDVDRFVKVLGNSEAIFAKYSVTLDDGTRVVIYNQQGEALADYIFGRSDFGSYGTARSVDSPIVYEIAKNIEYEVSPRLSSWRIPDIIKFQRSEADSVQVEFSGFTYTLTNEDNVWFFQNKTERFQLTHAHRTFFRAMNQLENLRTASFWDDEWDTYKDSFANPIVNISIYYKNQKIDVVTFAAHPENRCLIMVNYNHNTLYEGVFDMVNRFTRSADTWKNDVVEYGL